MNATTPELVHYSSSIQKLLLISQRVTIILLTFVIVSDLIVAKTGLHVAAVAEHYKNAPISFLLLFLAVAIGFFVYYSSRVKKEYLASINQQKQEARQQTGYLENYIAELSHGELNTQLSGQFENATIKNLLGGFQKELAKDKEEERIRAWESQGLTRFSEILRATHDINTLSDQVILFLVKYLSCNQGSVFITNTNNADDIQLELTACYAFERKKHVTHSVAIGQGLVSQCYLEQETIILLQVPADYIKITSGLGTGTPGFIAIVPIKNSDGINGVIEVASFKKLEPYQVAFLEKAAEAFSSVIQNVKTNAHVKNLLAESQQQMEMLRAQEEEMRQNMEELQSMQEQITRQLDENVEMKKELEAREKVLGLTTILSESDLFGTVTFVNEKFCQVSQYTSRELIGKGHNVVRHPDMPREIFRLMWDTIKRGQTFRGIVKNRKKDGSHYWVDATIVPIIENNTIKKYIGARYHIKDEELAQKLYNEQLMRLGLSTEVKETLTVFG